MAEVYQVWALGYDIEDECTDYDEFLGEFTDKAEAIAHAEKFKDISYVYDKEVMDELDDGDYLKVQVEVCNLIPEEEREEDEDHVEVVDVCWEQDIYKPGDLRAEEDDE